MRQGGKKKGRSRKSEIVKTRFSSEMNGQKERQNRESLFLKKGRHCVT